MKNLVFLFVVCALCSVGAVGQVGGGTMNSQAHALVMSGNPQHASQAAMSAEHSLIGHSTTTSAHGERPLWEVMPLVAVVPLGDSARALRKEHAVAKKAVIVWSN